jgi:tetratricopeptide (TPR) repeat protein
LPQRMITSVRHFIRTKTALAALLLIPALLCSSARGADKDDDKKPAKEKKQKIEPWVEIRTAHFIVASDGGEKTARRFADEFESLLRIFQSTMPKSRVTTGVPARLLVARDGQSFARVVPEFPFSKTHDQPAGAFVAGPEKTYVAIRANASGRFVFEDIFRDYARSVLKLSYRNLPPWIEEGYSTVYKSVIFRDGVGRLERPDPDDMSTLFESPLLPLDLVLSVDRASPYYSPGNGQSVYAAESRVLLHFLISDPQIAGTDAMQRYVAAVEGGADSLQSARNAFGDLGKLQARLDAYIKQVGGPPFEFSAAAASDSGGAPRVLSVPEAEARIADFLALRGRDGDAEDKLEDALMSEPSLAEAEQNLGFVELRKENLADAEKHLEHAAQLDPKDALNFYGLGLVAVQKAGKAGIPAGAADAFEKSVMLNPDFAPAWYNLALIYSEKDETLPKALADVQRAASLVPGNSEYQLQTAALLDQLGRREEARKTAAHVKETASDRATADKAGDLIARLSGPQSSVPAGYPNAAPPKPSSGSAPRLERKTEQEAKPSSTAPTSAAAKTEATPAPAPPPAPAPVPETTSVYSRLYSMVGTIAEVTCSAGSQLRITLKSLTITMKLHAEDLAKLSIKGDGSPAPAKDAGCASLRGRSARISYHLVSDKEWDGEIQDIELHAQP